jgi:hypothetical protein
LQNNNKGWRFWWSYANCSNLGGKVLSKGCVIGWWLQCEHYIWEFKKETRIGKTSIHKKKNYLLQLVYYVCHYYVAFIMEFKVLFVSCCWNFCF